MDGFHSPEVAALLSSPVFTAAVLALLACTALAVPGAAKAEEVGCVSTTFRMLGMANDQVCIDSFKDPKVDGVVCHVSRAKTGGISGAVGLAEDTSDASIACRQVGPINIHGTLKDGENVFKESRSWLFKKLQVVRFHDKPNNTLVYLSYSDKLVDGSPKNSISTVPIMPWGGK
jgi:CreA protein